MKAKVTLLTGAARIYGAGSSLAPFATEPTEAPHSAELAHPWAVGSATNPGKLVDGTFLIEAMEDGLLRHFTEAVDAYGNVTQSTDSEDIVLKEGQKAEFKTHNSNAFTVLSVERKDLEAPPPPELRAEPPGAGKGRRK